MNPYCHRYLVTLALVVAMVAPVVPLAVPDRAERAAILAPTSRFDAPERWGRLSGGSATNRKRSDRDAFSLPSANLSFEARAQFAIGNGLFRRPWVSSPSSTRSADGLGPLYTARSCQRCHLKDGRGHPPTSAEDSAVSMLVRLSVPPRTEEERALLASGRAAVIPEPIYDGQLQDVAVPGMAAEGRIRVTRTERAVTFDDGTKASLEEPRYAIVDTGYGPLDASVMTSPRVAPPMIGLGLLEAVAESDILARADPDDADGDGISGRPRSAWSREHGRTMLRRWCHTPKHATRRDWPVEELAGQLIWPYTDLLVHDMGDGLADGRPEGDASGREWWTAPLWGIGLTEVVNGHTRFLRDGRARNLVEAILWHGGEAHAATAAFRAMSEPEPDVLVAFLNSL